MKLALFTTETPHHAHFLRELARHFPVTAVFRETTALTPPFPTAHASDAERDACERERWFADGMPSLADLAPVHSFPSLNDAEAVAAIERLAPDVSVVFGTGRLKPPVIAAGGRTVNLHGGDPERYRGLDSHLWAVYHGDFDALVTTLHVVNPTLDDGDLILRAPVPLHRGMTLPQLRAANTELCVDLVRAALASYGELGRFLVQPQGRVGRYYSFMPAVMKDLCVKRFARYTRRLA